MNHHGDLAFYEAAAQVIPLIFIALALELRVFHPSPHDEEASPQERLQFGVMSVVVIMLLAAGEAAALMALFNGRASDWQRAVVVPALIIGGAIVPLIFVQLSFTRVRQSLPENWRAPAGRVARWWALLWRPALLVAMIVVFIATLL